MTTTAAAAAAPAHIEAGTAAFRRTNLALFAAGFSTFALMYSTQALMPELSRDFGVSAAASSLSLSLTTGTLAVAMLVASSLSEGWGRKPVMLVSLAASAALNLAAAAAPSWHALLLLRLLEGLALSGLPAVAMAYVGEEMHPRSIGLAMGLYIAGSGIGGMSGRLVTAVVADLLSWRWAMAAVGALGLVAAVLFRLSLPPSRHFRPRPLALGHLAARFLEHLRDEGLPWLFASGFLLMGSFVTVYNYVGYRLMAPPYGLGQTEVGAIFVVYLAGSASSALVGEIAGRVGRRKVLWIMILVMLAGVGLTTLQALPAIVAGIAVLTFGFFGAHSVASSWVGRRALHAKAQASSLYLFAYYAGGSTMGSLGGLFWAADGWRGVAGMVAALLVAALAIALRLVRLEPIAQPAPSSAG